MALLSKSKYLTGLQCPYLLWASFNDKKALPAFDDSTLHTFKQGELVGEFAKKLFPKGIDIPQMPFMENIYKTEALLKKRKPLFEAGFKKGNLFARADILKPAGKNQWDIIEVKSATKVKEINLHDVSFQKHVLEQCGVKIRKCYLMHINNKFVKKGKISPKKLFTLTEITEEVNLAVNGIENRISAMFEIIASKEVPECEIGHHCSNPYHCSLKNSCWESVPENSVTNFYRMGKQSFELINNGIETISNVPDDYKLNSKQIIQCNCEKNCKPHINKPKIKEFIEKLTYPLYFLDFETVSTAIPLYPKTRPFQQIPFQFSLHILTSPSAKLTHHSYLASSCRKIRENFLKELKKLLGKKGSIVVYSKSFETRILNELADYIPKEKKWVTSINKRIVDLLLPFRNFDYYSPKQQGSASLKKVLPALTGKTYAGLEIADGMTASREFLYTIHGELFDKKMTKKEIKKTREALEKYCELDTLAEVLILQKLEEVC